MDRLLIVDDDLSEGYVSRLDDSGNLLPAKDRSVSPVGGDVGYLIREFRNSFEVIAVRTPEDALRVLRAVKFNIVVLDVMMKPSGVEFSPEETEGGLRTGFVLARKLRNLYPKIPIVLLSQVVPGQFGFLNKQAIDSLISDRVICCARSKQDVSNEIEDFIDELVAIAAKGKEQK